MNATDYIAAIHAVRDHTSDVQFARSAAGIFAEWKAEHPQATASAEEGQARFEEAAAAALGELLALCDSLSHESLPATLSEQLAEAVGGVWDPRVETPDADPVQVLAYSLERLLCDESLPPALREAYADIAGALQPHRALWGQQARGVLPDYQEYAGIRETLEGDPLGSVRQAYSYLETVLEAAHLENPRHRADLSSHAGRAVVCDSLERLASSHMLHRGHTSGGISATRRDEEWLIVPGLYRICTTSVQVESLRESATAVVQRRRVRGMAYALLLLFAEEYRDSANRSQPQILRLPSDAIRRALANPAYCTTSQAGRLAMSPQVMLPDLVDELTSSRSLFRFDPTELALSNAGGGLALRLPQSSI
jgi:hypothetical protein